MYRMHLLLRHFLPQSDGGGGGRGDGEDLQDADGAGVSQTNETFDLGQEGTNA